MFDWKVIDKQLDEYKNLVEEAEKFLETPDMLDAMIDVLEKMGFEVSLKKAIVGPKDRFA